MVVEGAPELRERLVQIQIAVARGLDRLGMLVRGRDDHADAREDQDLVRAPPGRHGARLDVAVEGLGLLERLLTGEDGVRAACRELSSVLGPSRLKDHWLTLLGA